MLKSLFKEKKLNLKCDLIENADFIKNVELNEIKSALKKWKVMQHQAFQDVTKAFLISFYWLYQTSFAKQFRFTLKKELILKFSSGLKCAK